jgi:hypothetical protein
VASTEEGQKDLKVKERWRKESPTAYMDWPRVKGHGDLERIDKLFTLWTISRQPLSP